MASWSADSPRDEPETVSDLRRRLGLFSFPADAPASGTASCHSPFAGWSHRPGGIVEWLATGPGSGAWVAAIQAWAKARSARGVMAIVDPSGECYAPALSGWGMRPEATLWVRPNSRLEACWAIEQCLRCPGVSATWAWVDERFNPRVHRRWQLAAETGGGVGIIFRPETARREPVWADLRLLVTPQPGGGGEARRVRIDVLYHRGGLGGTAQVWEIDHAEGAVRLVSQVADSTAVQREA